MFTRRIGTAIGTAALVGAMFLPGTSAFAQPAANTQTIDSIQSALLRLPYYGVFDFLAFSYDKGTVTLTGYVYRPGLKNDAERVVKRVAGVDQVVNQIEALPLSPGDDTLRWEIYFAIYGDPFLSRYAPGGGMLWGHPHFVPRTLFGSAARFPGMEPAGTYPIAIIVKNGRVTLLGSVDSEADKTTAALKASQVPGVFKVDNELEVHKTT